MEESTFLEEIHLEWEGSHPVFDEFPLVESAPDNGFEIRPMLSVRGTSLKDAVLAFCGYMTVFDSKTINDTPMGNLILALCAVILVNPFEVKILRGKGIDPLIDASDFDTETGERFIGKREFLKFCSENKISQNLLAWLEQNNFVYTNQDRIVFKRALKSGRVLQKSWG